MAEINTFQKSAMLEELFGKTNWLRSMEITDLILTSYYPDIRLRQQLSAADVLELLRRSSFSGLFIASMNILRTDVLYKSRIHGQRHIERTAILSGCLALLLGLSEREFLLCLEAAKYHDTGRILDGEDPEHGRRSARKIPDLCRSYTETEQTLLQAVITAHSLPDREELPVFRYYCKNDIEAYRKYRSMIKILKDADALDRFRLSCHSLDIRYLRLNESHRLLRAACELVNM